MKPLTELFASHALRTLAALLVVGALFPFATVLAAPQAPSALDAPKPKSGDDFLPVDEAFRLGSLSTAPDRVRLVWQIADGYYLYRSRIKIKTDSTAVQIGTIDMPPGQEKNDEFFGKQQIYHHELIATVSLIRAGNSPLTLPLSVSYQGCAEAGLCFPPVTKTLTLDLSSGAASVSAGGPTPGDFVSEQDWYAQLAASGNVFVMLGGFFLAGLVLAFTPCVLPMVPILAGIISGQKDLSTAKAFLLSLSYVLGMAFTYTVAGAACAAAGAQVQAVFQQAWILMLFAALFVAMALSMFGVFTVQMPAGIQSRIAGLSQQQSAGTFGGVAVMGMLSALIVTTCVGPALVGALAVISQTGDIVRGASALFFMGLGMGTPLLLVGASQGRLLPRAGAWMETVKHLGGVMLLGVAAWMLDRILKGPAALLVWAVPAGAAAWVLLSVHGRSAGTWIARLFGGAAGLYTAAVLAGGALGAADPLDPLPMLTGAQRQEVAFQTIKSEADLEREVSRAKTQGKEVLLDFYADWCTSCKEMQKYTFTDPAVHAALKNVVLLRADVTRSDADDQALLKHFKIFGPPAILFYDRNGEERVNYRVVGYMKSADFIQLLQRLHQPSVAAGA